MKFVEVTTGHYSSERVALLFKPGTYAAGSEKADCFGGFLLAVFFFKLSIQRVGFLLFFLDEVFQQFFWINKEETVGSLPNLMVGRWNYQNGGNVKLMGAGTSLQP